jgi:DNA-binding MarR family transcriptional regulator
MGKYIDINISNATTLGKVCWHQYYLYVGRVTNPTFETTRMVRDACLCLHVQRAARALARRFDDALRPVGLTNGQFSLMMSLNRPEPPDMGAVASLLRMDRTTLTAALKPLQRRRLIKITVHPTDRRSRVMMLTPKGRSLLVDAVPIWRKTNGAVETLLPGRDPDPLRKSLRAVAS